MSTSCSPVMQVVVMVVVLLGVAVVGGEGAAVVELREVDNRVHGYRGFTWQTIDVSVYVENRAFEKRVVVHYKDSDGTWKDAEASYREARGDGARELWGVQVSRSIVSAGSPPQPTVPRLDMEFAVKYEVAGATYWDNNAGANYVSRAGSGELIVGDVVADYLNAKKPYTLPNGVRVEGWLSVGVLVKNHGFEKKVQVRYTTDGWRTTHVGDLSFNNGRMYGYSYVTYPNANNVEYWSGSFRGSEMQSETIREVQLAVSYEVNGKIFWDDNDGHNYRIAL